MSYVPYEVEVAYERFKAAQRDHDNLEGEYKRAKLLMEMAELELHEARRKNEQS